MVCRHTIFNPVRTFENDVQIAVSLKKIGIQAADTRDKEVRAEAQDLLSIVVVYVSHFLFRFLLGQTPVHTLRSRGRAYDVSDRP